jgi:hypothetical protein
MGQTTDFTILMTQILLSVVVVVLPLIFSAVLMYMIIQWFRFRGREKYSLQFVVLKVLLQKDNEVKIDAAEQMFAALYSLKNEGMGSLFKPEDHFTIEIVALKESIAFYVTCPRDLRDLIEKQVYGAYPSAEIVEVEEYNIFSEGGKVAFAALGLTSPTYLPIKVFKELPTDPLSLLTSALSKMGDGEGAVVQFVIEPARVLAKNTLQTQKRENPILKKRVITMIPRSSMQSRQKQASRALKYH